ncbi:MAG TPA: hypothetical protein V6C46_05325 [Coleofasciculaceae cyanobacterium]
MTLLNASFKHPALSRPDQATDKSPTYQWLRSLIAAIGQGMETLSKPPAVLYLKHAKDHDHQT